MADRNGSPARSTFKQDFLKFVTDRVAVAEQVMPGCDLEEYRRFSARHIRLFEEISDRLGEGGKEIFAEFDYTCESLAAFDADNAYIQGFADGMIFMGLFRRI